MVRSLANRAHLSTCQVALAAVSPLFSGAFLLFTSLMLLEKRIDSKFGGRPDYERYNL